MRLPPRGVCPLFLGGFFLVEIRKPCILRGFRQQHDVSVFSFSNVLRSCFLVAFFAKVSQIPCFSCFFKFNFSVIFEVFVWKSGKLPKQREVFAWSTCGKPSNKYPEMTTKTIRRRSTKQKENTSRIRMDVITPPLSPHHCTAPPHSRRRSTKQKENASRTTT